MKFIQKSDRREGSRFLRDVFIAYGKQISDREDGWYFLINFPFTRLKPYISPTTFETVTGPMRYSILYRRRPANEYRKSLGFFVKGWFPCED